MPSSRARRAAARRAAASRRRRFLLGVGAIVVVATAAAVLVGTRGGDADDSAPKPSEVREGSRLLTGRDERLTVENEPPSYRIAYRVDTFSDGERIVTRDDVAIDRPFNGRTRKRSGPEADSTIRSEQIGVLGRLYVPGGPKSDEALLETGPSIAPSDIRLAPLLDTLVASGQAERREWRMVLDTPCQVIRFGGPISSGTVAATLDPVVEYADACVSERGLVLEELWVVEGVVQRRRLAVELDEDAAVPASTFEPASSATVEPVPVDEGGGSFRPVQPDSAYAAPFWVADQPPLARHRGRWAVVVPAASDPNTEETKERRIGAVADIWQEGVDVVVVEQGSTAGGVKPFDLGPGPRVVVDGLGEGEVVLDLRMSELRFRRPGGYFVRVRGTVGPERLEEIARSLVETPGGAGITYLDG